MVAFGLRELLPDLGAALDVGLTDDSTASLDSRAARLVGAGGKGMVLKTLSQIVLKNKDVKIKKPPHNLGGFLVELCG